MRWLFTMRTDTSMEDVLEQLNIIEMYADVTIPRIYSTRISKPKYLFGREHEFEQLDMLLASKDNNCIFLTGMGGIGKSAFIRAVSYKQELRYFLYISIIKIALRQLYLMMITLKSTPYAWTKQANPARYFNRKLQKIRELTRGTNSILVIDNFTGKVDADLRAILATDLKGLF